MQQPITLVTGNKGKLTEWQRLMPAHYSLVSSDIDLDEIQSLDLEAIVADKVRRAYERLQTPVIVEDVAAGLDKLAGLPGPFIKHFQKQLGPDALYQLAGQAGDPVTVTCTAGYYDGVHLIVVSGVVQGSVCAARGQNGFGFDRCFVPDGQPKSFGEMEAHEKDALSHRSQAITKLLVQLEQLT